MLMSVFSGEPSTCEASSPQQSAGSLSQQSLSLSSQQSFVSSSDEVSAETADDEELSEAAGALLKAPHPVNSDKADIIEINLIFLFIIDHLSCFLNFNSFPVSAHATSHSLRVGDISVIVQSDHSCIFSMP